MEDKLWKTIWKKSKLNIEGIRTVEVPACILCGNSGIERYTNLRDRLFNSPGFYTIMECSVCNILWLSPRPIMEDLQKIYPQSSSCTPSPDAKEYNKVRRILKNAILATKFHYRNLPSNRFQKIFDRLQLNKVVLKPLRKKVELSIMYLDGRGIGRLLDVGCATGEFLVRMRELGWEVLGVDIDKNAVRIKTRFFG